MSKVKPIIKIEYVKKYLEGKISERKIADILEVSLASVQQWISNYNSIGEDAFIMVGNKRYSLQLKEAAVQDYLAGLGSQQNICQKYGIHSKSNLQSWIKKYNGHE